MPQHEVFKAIVPTQLLTYLTPKDKNDFYDESFNEDDHCIHIPSSEYILMYPDGIGNMQPIQSIHVAEYRSLPISVVFRFRINKAQDFTDNVIHFQLLREPVDHIMRKIEIHKQI